MKENPIIENGFCLNIAIHVLQYMQIFRTFSHTVHLKHYISTPSLSKNKQTKNKKQTKTKGQTNTQKKTIKKNKYSIVMTTLKYMYKMYYNLRKCIYSQTIYFPVVHIQQAS